MQKPFGPLSFAFVAVALATAGLAASPQEPDYTRPGKDAPKTAPAKEAPKGDAAKAAPPKFELVPTPEPKYAGPIKRMPDGTPDIRGSWNKNGGGLNEAPGTIPKSRLESECLEAFREKAEPAGFNNVVPLIPRPKNVYAPPPGRPNGVVDPADRVLPFTADAKKLRDEYAEKMCCPAISWDYVELSSRCNPPAPTQGGTVEIFQQPGQIVMLFEGNHGSRVIYTDGRPHMSQTALSFGGDSIGRWEGDTLIVETRNLNGLIHFGVARVFAPFSTQLKFTERFTVRSRQLIDYEIIYEDPKTFTKPVKSVGFLFPTNDDYEAMETTCIEGSYTLKNMYGF
jgi:hypothetical protein